MVKNLGPHLVPNAKIFGSGLVPGTENSLVPAQILGPESLKVVLNLGPRLVPVLWINSIAMIIQSHGI